MKTLPAVRYGGVVLRGPESLPASQQVLVVVNDGNNVGQISSSTVSGILGYTAANDSLVVHLAGAETITGAKTFSQTIYGTTLENASGVLSLKGFSGVDIGQAAIYGPITLMSGYGIKAKSDSGLSVRNTADTADAPITAGSVTTSSKFIAPVSTTVPGLHASGDTTSGVLVASNFVGLMRANVAAFTIASYGATAWSNYGLGMSRNTYGGAVEIMLLSTSSGVMGVYAGDGTTLGSVTASNLFLSNTSAYVNATIDSSATGESGFIYKHAGTSKWQLFSNGNDGKFYLYGYAAAAHAMTVDAANAVTFSGTLDVTGRITSRTLIYSPNGTHLMFGSHGSTMNRMTMTADGMIGMGFGTIPTEERLFIDGFGGLAAAKLLRLRSVASGTGDFILCEDSAAAMKAKIDYLGNLTAGAASLSGTLTVTNPLFTGNFTARVTDNGTITLGNSTIGDFLTAGPSNNVYIAQKLNASGLLVGSGDDGYSLRVSSTSAGSLNNYVRGASGQTAKIWEFQDVSGNALVSFGPRVSSSDAVLLELNSSKQLIQGVIARIYGYASSYVELTQSHPTGVTGTGRASPVLRFKSAWNDSGIEYTPAGEMVFTPTGTDYGYLSLGYAGSYGLHVYRYENRVSIVGVNSLLTSAQLNIEPSWTGKKGILVRLVASHTENAFEVQNSAGNPLTYILPSGDIYITTQSSTAAATMLVGQIASSGQYVTLQYFPSGYVGTGYSAAGCAVVSGPSTGSLNFMSQSTGYKWFTDFTASYKMYLDMSGVLTVVGGIKGTVNPFDIHAGGTQVRLNYNGVDTAGQTLIAVASSYSTIYQYDNLGTAQTLSPAGNTLRGGVTLSTGNFVVATSSTPASAVATGVAGTITWDADYVYVCTATNTWKRAALTTW